MSFDGAVVCAATPQIATTNSNNVINARVARARDKFNFPISFDMIFISSLPKYLLTDQVRRRDLRLLLRFRREQGEPDVRLALNVG